jgi:small subunit ribosomal protein S13
MKEEKQENKKEKKQEAKPISKRPEEKEFEMILRIMGYDIPGTKSVFVGLTRIKGVSWAISNILCRQLKIPKSKKIGDLSKDEIKKIEETLKTLKAPDFMKNRRNEESTGETVHLFGNDLQMRKDFDIKLMKKIKSYKGIRHTFGLPVRGQRTRANFRKNKNKASGVKGKK